MLVLNVKAKQCKCIKYYAFEFLNNKTNLIKRKMKELKNKR